MQSESSSQLEPLGRSATHVVSQCADAMHSLSCVHAAAHTGGTWVSVPVQY